MSLIQFKSFLIQAGLASEFCLLTGICLIVLLAVFTPKAAFGLSFWVSLFALGLGFYFAGHTPESGNYLSFTFHPFGGYVKRFFCISASVALFGFMEWRQGRNEPARPEIFILLLLSVIGLEVMIQAGTYWSLFLAAELFSICGFAFSKPTPVSESNYKQVVTYFGVGALSSAIGVFGLSWIVGFEGSLILANDPIHQSVVIFQAIGALMFISFLVFKLGGFPFHFWVPSVYSSAPTPWVGYISVAPKVAGAFAFLYLSQKQEVNLVLPILILAVLGISLGNLAALRSEKVKNMLAYSAIAQAAMLLIPAVISYQIPDAEYQLLIFAIGYGVVNQGAFCAVQYFENVLGDDFRISDMAGKIVRHPLAGISLIIIVLSIIGLPPTIGFMGKLLVFSTLVPAMSLWESNVIFIAFGVLVFNTLLSLAYYYQIPYQLIFKESKSENPWIRSSFATLLWAIVSAFFAIMAFAKPIAFFPHS